MVMILTSGAGRSNDRRAQRLVAFVGHVVQYMRFQWSRLVPFVERYRSCILRGWTELEPT